MAGIYEQVKEQVTAREAAEFYGHKVNRNGMMCCPFHDDRTPSMKVDKNFICFGCQEKGDVIDFTAKLFSLTPYEAAGKLISDMGVSVDTENRPKAPPGIRRSVRRELSEQQRFKAAVDRTYRVYCDYYHLLNRWAKEYAPHSPTEDIDPRFEESMQRRTYVEYLLDLLFNGSKEDQASVLIEHGKEVNELEKRIKELESGDRERTSCGPAGSLAGDDGGAGHGDAYDNGKRSGHEHDFKRCHDPVL